MTPFLKFLLSLVLFWGGTAVSLELDLYPNRSMYKPGEAVVLRLEAPSIPANSTAHLRVFHLHQLVHQESQAFAKGLEFNWTPPPSAAGYGAEVNLTDASGITLASASTAFDVHQNWLEMPRYGFLTEFGPHKADPAQMDYLLKRHINALQFYDWMYRHDQHLPPQDDFIDPLGRTLSLETTRERIAQAHQRGMAAMPYTTIYGGSAAYFAQHPEQALYKDKDHPWTLGENFLYIFDPSEGSAWRTHLMQEYRSILESLPFDGLHIDQYGDPKNALTANGKVVDLAAVIPGFVKEAKAIAGDKAVLFNLVNDWPVETYAPSGVDAVYIEVWPPHDNYAALRDIVYRAKQLSSNRPVILAAYLTPKADAAYRLLSAVVAASGATHLELGEGDGVLADPYFPKYEHPSPELATWLRGYYDFITRYQEWLYGLEVLKLPEQTKLSVPFTIGSFPSNKVWLLGSHRDKVDVLHLINLTSSPLPLWKTKKDPPQILSGIKLHYPTQHKVVKVYFSSPDRPERGVYAAQFEQTATLLTIHVPRLEYWSMLVVEYL